MNHELCVSVNAKIASCACGKWAGCTRRNEKPGHFTLRAHREFQLHIGKVRQQEAQQVGMFEEKIDLFGMGESR